MATLTPAPQHIPSWTFADRMRKARIDAGLTAQQIADAIGISRKSVTNYESGETKPLKPILAAWSLICHGCSDPRGGRCAPRLLAPVGVSRGA